MKGLLRQSTIETKNGIELTAYNPEFAKQVEIAERAYHRTDALF
jgi:hypothetical protein